MREATKADRPRIGSKEAQCVVCWRMFTSNSAADAHARWSKPKTETCKEPSTLGLVARDRRGLRVWTRPRPEGAIYPGLRGNGGN